MEKLTPQASSDWNTACLRLEDYLRAHRVQPRERLLGLSLELLGEARNLHANGSSDSPVRTAMGLATARTEAWFSRLLDESAPPDAVRAARGRVAFFTSGADRRWPEAFLDPDPPRDMLAAVRAASIQAGPAMEFQSLTRKEMDYGAMEDIARETWEQFSWGHVLRAFALWVAIFFVAYGIWLKFFT